MSKVKIEKYKLRRRITPTRVIKAIPGTGGIKTIMAEVLGCGIQALNFRLRQPGPAWDDVRELIRIESETVGDEAEQTIRQSMGQRLDFGVASTTARWYLDRKHADRGYGKKSQVTLEGGKVPLQIRNQTVLPINELELPLEVKVQILDAMEKYEEKKRKAEEKS